MNLNITVILSVFVLASFIPLVLRREKIIRAASLLFSFIGGISVFFLAIPVLFGYLEPWSDNLIFLDRFSALMAFLVAFIYIAASLVSYKYIGHEYEEGILKDGDVRLYFSLLQLFVLGMLMTVLTNNTLILWIALESTTLSSTFLVGLYRKKASVEAAWKYIIICTTGISLGLIGILLLGFGARSAGVAGSDIFLLTSLLDNAYLIQPGIAKFAFVFLFIGFGVKVGLAPMHTWLPDAHSKAPSPISAIFSGILLNVALYAIIRFTLVVDGSLKMIWTNYFFLFFSLVSITLSALMMLIQTNYKRMLAYSSIEHMGLIAFALALPPIGTIAAVIHMIGHTFTKSLLFFGAGEILMQWKTTTIEKVRGVYAHNKYTGILFLSGILMIIALPPSALFVSEYTMFITALSRYPILALIILIMLSIIAYSMLRLTVTMIFFNEDDEKDREKKHKWSITHSVMLAQLVIIGSFSFWITSDRGQQFVNNIAKDITYTLPK